MTKYRPSLQLRDPLLVRQVLEGEAGFHALAVEIARQVSGFTDEQAIHAFAFTVEQRAERILNGSPDLELADDWLPHDAPLDNLADLHLYARYSHLHPMLAFVGLVCLEWVIDSQRVKEILRLLFRGTAEFNAVPDYIELARKVVSLEEERVSLGAE